MGHEEVVEQWFSQGVSGDMEGMYLPPGAIRAEEVTMEAAKTLVQLATPEAVLNAQYSLPVELLQSYIAEQEHFDFAKAVLRLGPEQTRGDGPGWAAVADRCLYQPVTKSVVYTRAAQDFLEVESTSPRGAVRPNSPFGDAVVAVLNFDAVRTQLECETFLKEFSDEGA